jgi:AraC-type DNA-binding domain-containing proteins
MTKLEESINALTAGIKLNRYEEDLQRIPLEAENDLIKKVKQGQYRDIHIQDPENNKDNIGIVAKDMDTQEKYLLVSFIAVISRAAIDGGASADDVLDLADALLFYISFEHKTTELEGIYEIIAVKFAKLVYSAHKKTLSYPVAQAQKYISSNIFKKISIEDIAEYVSLTPNYLSRIFKVELGISIHNYIQKEKVTVACNFLKYTPRPISCISNYMGFQSQSNFSVIFKKWTNMTPSEYREQNYSEVY